MLDLMRLHTVVRGQVRSDERKPYSQGNVADRATFSPAVQRALAAWRYTGEQADMSATLRQPTGGSDEWTSRTPDRQ